MSRVKTLQLQALRDYKAHIMVRIDGHFAWRRVSWVKANQDKCQVPKSIVTVTYVGYGVELQMPMPGTTVNYVDGEELDLK